MKKIYSKFLFTSITILGVFAFCSTWAQSWAPLGSADFSAGSVYGPVLTVARNGSLYVLYEDLAKGAKCTVQEYTAAGWAVVDTAGFSGKANFTSIAINRKGVPYVAYSDADNGNEGTVLKYNGSAWVPVGTNPFFTALNATYTDIAIDTFGTPYVVYVDGHNYFKATVAQYDTASNTWFTTGGGGFSAGEADYTNIAITLSGTPYVVYQDADSNYKATVKAYNGVDWQLVGNQGFSAGRAYTTDIDVDSNGTPYVVYSDYGYGGKATVMKYTGSEWVNVGSAGFSDSIVQYTTITIDSSGTPYVAYTEGGDSAGGKATVMRFNGTNWEPVCHTEISKGRAHCTSVAVSTLGVPLVAYMDYTDSNRITVLIDTGSSACFPTAVNNVATTTTLSVYPNPATTELTLTAGDPIRSVVISNLVGQTVSEQLYNSSTVQIDISRLPSGVYFARVNNTDVRKFVKE